MKSTITPVQELIFVLGLMVSMIISLFCLVGLSLSEVHEDLLAYFNISDDILFLSLLLLCVVNNYIGMRFLGAFYRKRFSNNSPKLTEEKHLLQLEYPKTEWLKFKKEEFEKTKRKLENRRFFIGLSLLVFALFFCFVEFTVGLIVANFIIFFTIPIHPVIKEPFEEAYYNNILFESNTYKVKVYKKGLTVNNYYYGYKHFSREGASTQLIAVDLAKEASQSFLEFTTYSVGILPTFDDFNGGEVKHTATLKIPVLEHHNIDMKKLRSQLL